MAKRKNIIYWVSTLWLALGMSSTGIVRLLRVKTEVDFVTNLGYPVYFLTILGIWKLLGVIGILIPRSPLLKEWAYAGFFFAMSGAIISHIAKGDEVKSLFPSLFLLALTIVSWYFRPPGRTFFGNQQSLTHEYKY